MNLAVNQLSVCVLWGCISVKEIIYIPHLKFPIYYSPSQQNEREI